jgi:hypothetical protein
MARSVWFSVKFRKLLLVFKSRIIKRRKENYNIIRLFVCCGPLMHFVCSSKQKAIGMYSSCYDNVVGVKLTADRRNGNSQKRSFLIWFPFKQAHIVLILYTLIFWIGSPCHVSSLYLWSTQVNGELILSRKDSSLRFKMKGKSLNQHVTG